MRSPYPNPERFISNGNPADAAFGQAVGLWPNELPTILLTKTSEMSIETLETMIVDGYFRPSRLINDDPWETQLEQFRAMAHQLAATHAKPSAEPRKDALVSDSSHSRTSP